jgi:8-oxo-dGTP diphosphatase
MPHPRIGVCLAIRREDKLLMHKRISEHCNGAWAFPGGHLEFMEVLAQAAIREMKEEAGPDLVVSHPKFWTMANARYFDEIKHYLTIFMVSDWISGEARVMEPDKCEYWHWFRWTELPAPRMKSFQMVLNLGGNPFKDV